MAFSKEDFDKFGLAINIVQFEEEKAIITLSGPGTENFITFIRNVAASQGAVDSGNLNKQNKQALGQMN